MVRKRTEGENPVNPISQYRCEEILLQAGRVPAERPVGKGREGREGREGWEGSHARETMIHRNAESCCEGDGFVGGNKYKREPTQAKPRQLREK